MGFDGEDIEHIHLSLFKLNTCMQQRRPKIRVPSSVPLEIDGMK